MYKKYNASLTSHIANTCTENAVRDSVPITHFIFLRYVFLVSPVQKPRLNWTGIAPPSGCRVDRAPEAAAWRTDQSS